MPDDSAAGSIPRSNGYGRSSAGIACTGCRKSSRPWAREAQALIQQLDAACRSVDDLATATEEAFLAHPEAGIITSFPGLPMTSGARVLAEVGDDRKRFADARVLAA
ncbi:hypothetical protein [Streptomyces sp. Ag109_O5-10]|uniref:hypothetical protein n=1 Tax=Streptomyces sp. Ag109_O5-10 TaxID=1855349 RepID=UPI00210F1158|nr:hypothetical protein [Streptomyces sp. Ag109_O5-10]